MQLVRVGDIMKFDLPNPESQSHILLPRAYLSEQFLLYPLGNSLCMHEQI